MVSKIFDKSVRLLQIPFYYRQLSSIYLSLKRDNVADCNLFLNYIWNFKRILSKWFESCQQISFSNIFEISDTMLIGLQLYFWFLEPYLNAAAMFANLKKVSKIWWTYCFVVLKINIFRKTVSISFENFYRNIYVLYCFIRLQFL